MVSIRVWHHNPRGDDYYYRFKSLKSAKSHIRTHRTAEREPTILHKGKEYPVSQLKRLRKMKTVRRKRKRSSNFGFGDFGFKKPKKSGWFNW